MRNENINPVGLILSRADSGIASLERSRTSAQSSTGFRISEGDKRLGISSRTERGIAATAVVGSAGDGQIIFAVESDACCWNGGTVGTGESRSIHVDIGQTLRGSIRNDLRVHRLASCPKQI